MIERDYYPIGTAAEQIGCSVRDLIHLGAVGKLPLHIYLSDKVQISDLQEDEFGNKVWVNQRVSNFTGLAQVLTNTLQELEKRLGSVGDVSVDTRKLLLAAKDEMPVRLLMYPPATSEIEKKLDTFRKWEIRPADLYVITVDLAPYKAQSGSATAMGSFLSDEMPALLQLTLAAWETHWRTYDHHELPTADYIASWLSDKAREMKTDPPSDRIAKAIATIIRPEAAPAKSLPREK